MKEIEKATNFVWQGFVEEDLHRNKIKRNE